MRKGFLSEYFDAVAAKRLSEVEADPEKSNQHEFNGSKALRQVLGTNDTGDTMSFPARLVWMGEENEGVTADCTLSWYDSRFDQPHRSPEWRLYFPTTEVTAMAKAGDLLIVARRTDGTVMIIVVTAGSTVENQLLWLFDVPVQEGKSFVYQDFQNGEDREVDFAVRFILEELGIEVEEPEADRLDGLLERFNNLFPVTADFSEFARSTLPDVDPIAEPDKTLVAWMNQEELLFRRLERQIIGQRIQNGFGSEEGTDVEGFLSFSMSVHQRRKSRAGYAFEHHISKILTLHQVRFAKNAITEANKKPDFLFPGQQAYNDPSFPADMLTLLGAKTTLKERWRQVHAEAERITHKHILTLEPGISVAQTDEMRADRMQLVVPYPIHETYRESQRAWIMKVSDFIGLVKDKQSRTGL